PRKASSSRPTVVSQGSAARFAERAALRRRLLRRRIGRWTGATAVVGGVVWALLLSPLLELDARQVEILGAEEVVDLEAIDQLVAQSAGVPLPRVDTVGLRRDVLEVRGVREAEVERLWPHGLRVSVVARVPVAAVPEGEEVVLLDAEGVQVARVAEAPDGLPTIRVPLDEPDNRTTIAVLTVLRALPEDLAEDVVGVSASSRDAVTLTLADGARVLWGSADESVLKAEVLQVLRSSDVTDDTQVFDVSAPRLPITGS
ncbi:cell division protein FtsQ, partial [Cellulomonas bogoriensis 69B4 = DSM 16987]